MDTLFRSQVGLAEFGNNSGITTVVWDHNAYFAMPPSGSGNPSEQNASGNPFRNVAQSPGANDFHLTRDTSQMGLLGLLYNLDPDGVTRTSSRGAFQFGPLSRPNPPPNLNVR